MVSYEDEAQEEQFQANLDREQASSGQEPFIETNTQFRVKAMERNEPTKLGKYFSQKEVLMGNLNEMDKNVIMLTINQIALIENISTRLKMNELVEIGRDYGESLKTYLNYTGGRNGKYFNGLITDKKEITRRVGDAFKPGQQQF